jgi:hypothetical protein
MRTAVLAVGVVALAAAGVPAQEGRPWADKLFLETKCETAHDFGGVPHGAQLYHRFTFKNIYAVPLDLSITRVSCGCVTATPSTRVVKPHESAHIDVNMNGRQFTGPRTVRISVQFSNPQFFSTAELKVTANSRPDVVFNPGQINFGLVGQGQAAAQSIDVEYAGSLAWRVTGVVANGLPVDVEAPKLKYQRPGQVGYTVTVTLKPDVPAGALKGEMFLRTNDPASPLVPVLVEATVQPSLSVAPSALRPRLRVNEEETVSVLVRGDKDFRVLAVEGLGDGIDLVTRLPDAPSPTHRLTFKLRGAAEGDFRRKLQIKTDHQAAPLAVSVDGTVTP